MNEIYNIVEQNSEVNRFKNGNSSWQQILKED